LVLAGNGLSGPSPIDIPLVDNKREKSRVILTSICLFVKNSHKSDLAMLK